jgi:hypothetical protein
MPGAHACLRACERPDWGRAGAPAPAQRQRAAIIRGGAARGRGAHVGSGCHRCCRCVLQRQRPHAAACGVARDVRRQRGPSSRQSQGQLGKKTCGWEPSGGIENSTTHPGPPPRLCPWATGRASWVHLQSDKGSGGAGREARRRRVAPASGSGQLPPKRVAGLRPTPATHPPILRGFSSFLIRSFSSRFSSSLRQKVPGKLCGPLGGSTMLRTAMLWRTRQQQGSSRSQGAHQRMLPFFLPLPSSRGRLLPDADILTNT